MIHNILYDKTLFKKNVKSVVQVVKNELKFFYRFLMRNIMYHIDVYKETKEDWYPCFKMDNRDFVNVSFYKSQSEYIVCVWGNDDCGMEKIYTLHEESTALNHFYQIIGQEFVTSDFLKSLNFKSA